MELASRSEFRADDDSLGGEFVGVIDNLDSHTPRVEITLL